MNPAEQNPPLDWEIARIDEVTTIKSGSTPLRAKQEKYFDAGTIPWVKTMDLTDGLIYNTDEKITEIAVRETSCPMLKPGTVLVAMYGGFNQIGRTGLMTFSGSINQAISALIPDEDVLDPRYLLNWLNCNVMLWRRLAASSRKDPNITRNDVAGFPVFLPPLPEQRKIAEILGTWDEAIAATEELLAALERRKQGLMQRLLTGQVRFGEFGGSEWRYEKAGDIFRSHSQRKNGDEELLSATQDQGVIPRSMLETRVTMPEGSTESYKLVEPGDFIISLRTFQGGIEYSEYRGLVSPAYTVLKPKIPIVNEFYRHLFKSTEFIGRLAVAVIGIRDGKQISYSDFAAMKLAYPSIPEQKRIAQVLKICDEEIGENRRKLATLQTQKKGLMQRLLTGQVRVAG